MATVGQHTLAQLTNALTGRMPPALVVDAALRHSPLVEGVRTAVGSASPVITRPHWASLDDARALLATLGTAATVVAVGGGSVLDCVKLALALEDGGTCAAITLPQRGGWVYAPGAPRRRRLIALPTTLGTGSEVSTVVSFVHRGGKRALTSPTLPADATVLDAACTAGLSRSQVLQGAMEALLRAAGPYVGDHVERPQQDAAALGLVRDIATLVAQIGSGSAADDWTRLALARLSQRAHHEDLLAGRRPFATTWWFVANDTAHVLRVPKMTALLWVLPRIWARMPARPAFGSAAHRDRVWATVREVIPVALPDEPAEGCTALVRWLGLPLLPSPTHEQAHDIARSCVRLWGGGLPMLANLPYAVLLDLLTTEPHPSQAAAAAGPTAPRRPVAVGIPAH
ncbi:MAG: iron-containing alcohol dehydrogenase [Dermatophilaceae bacterium]